MSETQTKRLRRDSLFQLFSAGLILVGLALVSGIGYFAFTNLSRIIHQSEELGQQDIGHQRILALTSDFLRAENSVKVFNLTRDSLDLAPYRRSLPTLQARMADLETQQYAYIPPAMVDSLADLLQFKLNLLDSIRQLPQPDVLTNAFGKVYQTLESQVPEESSSDSPGPDTLTLVEQEKKRNFFQRLFGKKKKKKTEEAEGQLIQEPVEDDTVDLLALQAEFVVIQNSESRNFKRALALETDLNRQLDRVNQEIETFLEWFEVLEYAWLMDHSRRVENLANETNRITLWFSIAVTLALLVLGIGVFSYIRINRRARKAIERAKSASDKLARDRKRFLANMSHEIRTPLNAISGFTEQVLQGPLETEQQEKMEIVRKANAHLLQILNSILDFSRLESDKLSLEKIPFDPADSVAQVTDLLRPTTKGKNLFLKLEMDEGMPPAILGDPLRFRQILFNLLGNALKFTTEGGITVRLRVRSTSRQNAIRLLLSVTDTGPGIAKDKQAEIFREFSQSDTSVSRNFGGTGLGLTISRRLAKLMGGRIRLESTPGKGSTFLLEIPCEVTEALPAEKNAPKSENKLDFQRALIVDDTEFNRKLLRGILEKWGGVVEEAGSGEMALKIASRKQYDLLLVDLRMPGIDGLECIERMRKLAGYKMTPAYLVSAETNEKVVEQALAVGADGFLAKPFSEQDLIDLLQKSQAGLAPISPEPKLNPEAEASVQASPLTKLEKITGGNTAMMLDLLETFLRSAGEQLPSLAAHIQASELAPAREIAHKLAPPCRHLGLDRLYELLRSLETVCSREDPEAESPRLLRHIEQEFEERRPELEAAATNLKPDKP